jgi:6-phosphogluconolactonase
LSAHIHCVPSSFGVGSHANLSFAIAADGSLSLEDAAAGIAVEGMPGLRDEDLSSDGRFLYALDADGGRIYGWSVDAEGSLEPVGSWDGLPATVAGLAAT